jgi:hypothetical protein
LPLDHLLIKDLPTSSTEPGLLLIPFHETVPDPNGSITFFTEEHDVGDMKGCLLFQNSSSSLLTVRPRMTFYEIDLFNDHLLLLWKNLQDPTTLTLFLPIDHHHQVILFDMKFLDAHSKFHSQDHSPCVR